MQDTERVNYKYRLVGGMGEEREAIATVKNFMESANNNLADFTPIRFSFIILGVSLYFYLISLLCFSTFIVFNTLLSIWF
jgi:hypothetical protein